MRDESLTEVKPANILVVDDTPANLDLLVNMVKDRGYTARPAPNGKIALKAAEIEPPDLIMLDINMPDLNGFEVCRRLKQNPQLAGIPVIFISALTETLDKVTAFEVGGSDYVTKPFQFEEVAARIETHLKLHRYQTQIETWNQQLAAKVRDQIREISQQNEQLNAQVDKTQQNYTDMIAAFSNLLELRHPHMRGHSNNVAEVAVRVADGMGAQDPQTVKVAGQLHDIGKIGLRLYLLQKDAKSMNPEEFEEYRMHPVRGQAAIDGIESLREVGLLIRHHHESYNGRGFPDGLKKEQIPLGARIIKIADRLDWLIQNSRKEDRIETALAAIKNDFGQSFDPQLYRWFEEPVREYYSSAAFDLQEAGMIEHDSLDLVPGMVLADDVFSGTGILLLRRGNRLNEKSILTLQRMYRYDPPDHGIYIAP
jgi:response regulator RpfG family c-di-GMP phosphodiesterase